MATAIPLNNAVSRLAMDHTSGSGTLVLKPGEGVRFGSPTVDAPIRVTIAARSTLVAGQIAPTSTQTIFLCTARTDDTLSGLTPAEGTSDGNYFRNDPVASLITAGTLSDIASSGGSLPAGATGALLVAITDAAPVFDPNCTWDRDNRQWKLKGQPVGTGGDRHNLQTATGVDLVRYDLNGTGHHHMGAAANPTNLVSCWHPAKVDPTYPVTFNFSVSSNANPNDDPTSWNNVGELGWNTDGGGGQNPDLYSFRDAWENHYWASGSVFQTERHVGVVRDPVTGLEVRPYTCAVVVSEGWPFRTQITLSTSDFRVLDETANTLIAKNTWNSVTSEYAANAPGWGYTTNPTGGFSGLIGDVGGPTTFAMTGNTVSIPFKIAGVQKFELFAGADNRCYLNNAAGSEIVYFDQAKNALFQGTVFCQGNAATVVSQRWQNFMTADGDFSWVMPGSGSPAGWLYLTHQSGTIPIVFSKVGFAFFGGTPVAKGTITGSRSDGTALASLLTYLALRGDITNSTTT